MIRKENKIQSHINRKCKECAHHYDEHSKAIDGHLILCRCPFKMNGGEYCIFLNDDACERFKPMAHEPSLQAM